MTDLTPGQTFGAFRVGPALGSNKRLRRFLAKSTAGEPLECVLEALPTSACDNAEEVAWFRERMRRATRTHHPGVECCLAAGRFRGVYYLIYERVPGVDLAEIAARWFPDPWDPALIGHIASSVASSLAYLHRFGLAHGELTPRDLRLEKQGRIRICALRGPHPAGVESEDIGALGKILRDLIATSPQKRHPVLLLDLVKRMCSKNKDHRPSAAEMVRGLLPIAAPASALAALQRVFFKLEQPPVVDRRVEVTALMARDLSFAGAGDDTVRAQLPLS